LAKHGQNNRWRKFLAFATSSFLSVALFVPMGSAPANAAEFDVNFAAMNFDEATQDRVLYRGYPSSGTTTNIAAGASAGTAGQVADDRVLYKNVITVGGTSIDALIKTVAISAGTSISAFDGGSAVNGNPALFQTNLSQGGNNQKVTFSFTFYVSGSYSPVGDSGTTAILKNVLVNSYDLDGSTGNSSQFSEMTGFQSYRLSSNTTLAVTTANGVTRFQDNTGANASYTATSGSYTEGRVQVRFNYLSTFTVSHGVNNQGSGGTSYFALDFGPGISAGTLNTTTWLDGSTQVSTVSTNNTAGNRPPTSTDTTLYVSTTSPRVLEVADFGSYSDLDLNPFVQVRIDALPSTGALELYTNSAWVSVSANAIISTSEIEAGNLRYLHTSLSNDTLTFSVFDGLAYSTATNAITFVPTTQTQIITFNNPGSKTPSQTISSSATADSNLTVTLVSNTPGICTVSGLDIVILANTGNCSITASQAGNSTYAAATSVTQVFSVTNSVTTYTITYNGNSADSGTTPANQTGNGTVTLASNTGSLVKSGFTFGGWTIASQTYSAGGSYNLAANVTATAIWTSNTTYTITYNGNSADSGTTPANQTGNGSVTLASNTGSLVKSGYTFGGWTIGGQTYAAGGSYSLGSNVTATAIWTAVVVNQPAPAPMVYSLTFLAPTSNQGSTPPVMVGNAAVIPGNIGNLTRPGYVFKGWTIEGVDYTIGSMVILSSNRIAYAYWVPKVITFVDTSSGTIVAQPIEGTDLVKLPGVDEVTKSGFVLAGWLIGDKTYAPGEVIAIEEVANATALWTEYLSVPGTEEETVVEEVQETVLADTGLSSQLWLAMASLLLAAGVVLMRLSRRRV
jgi:Listeria-Bacteroides repeat domain (List_Bact_rpt)